MGNDPSLGVRWNLWRHRCVHEEPKEEQSLRMWKQAKQQPKNLDLLVLLVSSKWKEGQTSHDHSRLDF